MNRKQRRKMAKMSPDQQKRITDAEVNRRLSALHQSIENMDKLLITIGSLFEKIKDRRYDSSKHATMCVSIVNDIVKKMEANGVDSITHDDIGQLTLVGDSVAYHRQNFVNMFAEIKIANEQRKPKIYDLGGKPIRN